MPRQRRSASRQRRTAWRRRSLVESLESRRLLAVVGFDEAIDGDLDADSAAPAFVLDSAGTNSWVGSVETRIDPSDGFAVRLAPGVSVTDIRLSYLDDFQESEFDNGIQIVASGLFDHQFFGTGSVSAGSFSETNPTLPITNTNFSELALAPVLVDASDTFASGSWTIEIETSVVPLAPVITSAAAVNVNENTTFVTDVESEDENDGEGSGLAYSISGGDDQSLFSIDSTTGVVTFLSAPNFESPSDSDADNQYHVDVTVSDTDGLTDTQSLVVTVLDVDELPVADAGGPYSIDAGLPLSVDASGSSDSGSGGTLTYAWDLDADNVADFVTPNPVDTIPWLTVIDHIGVGTHNVILTVSDSGELSSTDTAVVNISEHFIYPVVSDGTADAYTLVIDGADLQVNDTASGTLLSRVPVATIVDTTVRGSTDQDVMTVDYGGGPIEPPIFFGGNAPTTNPGDTIRMENGSVITVEHTFVNESDGTIDVDFGGGVTSTIEYTGLEPIVDNLDAVNRIFTFTGGSESISISDNGTEADDTNLIDSTLGESVEFVSPTGTLTVNAGSGEDTVDFIGLDALAAFATMTINGDEADDSITVETLGFGLTANLNGGAGDDSFVVGNGTLDLIAGDLVIVGDANGAMPTVSDSVSVKGVSADVALEVGDRLELNDSLDVTGRGYTLDDGLFSRSDLSSSISFATVETVELTTGSESDEVVVSGTTVSTHTIIGTGDADDDVTISTTGAGSLVSLSTGNGEDDLTILSTGIDSVVRAETGADDDDVAIVSTGVRSGVAIDSGVSADVVELSGTGSGSAVEFHLGSQADIANIQRIASGSAVDVDGGDGNDTVNVSSAANGTRGDADGDLLGDLDGLLGDLCVHGSGHDGGIGPTDSVSAKSGAVDVSVSIEIGDVLNVIDEASGSDNVYQLNATTFDPTRVAGVVTYDTIESLNVETGSGSDEFQLNETVDATFTSIGTNVGDDLVLWSDSGADAIVHLATGSGNDEVRISTTGARGVARVTTGIGEDDVAVTMIGESSGLAIDAGADDDVLSIFSTGDSAALSATLGDGDDIANVRGTSVGSASDVMGDAGDDTFNVTSTANGDRLDRDGDLSGELTGILGDLCVFGGDHVGGSNSESVVARQTIGTVVDVTTTVDTGDSLNVSDESSGGALSYAIASDSIQRSDVASIGYETIESVLVEAGGGASTVDVDSTAPATSLTLLTFAGDDLVRLATTGDGSITSVDTGDDSDQVSIASTGNSSVSTVTTGSAVDTLTVSSLGDLSGIRADTDDGDDLITLDTEAAAPARSGTAVIVINSGSGEDTLDVNEVFLNTTVDLSGQADNDTFNLNPSGSDAQGYLRSINNDPNGSDATAATRQLFLDGGGNDAGTETVTQGISVVGGFPVAGEALDVATGDRVRVNADTATSRLDLRYVMTSAARGVLATTVPSSEEDSRATVGNEVFESLGIESVDLTTGSADDILTVSSDVAIDVTLTEQLVRFSSGEGSDKLEVVGGDGADLITVGEQGGMLEPFEVDGVEFLRLDGNQGDDEISSLTNAVGLLNGGDDSDIVTGGNGRDLITGGGGTDFIFGNAGNDVLFTDRDFGNPDDLIDGGEIIDGGSENDLDPGDVCVQLGADEIRNCETLGDGGGTKDVLTWLRGILIPLDSFNLDGGDESLGEFEPVADSPVPIVSVTEPSQIPNSSPMHAPIAEAESVAFGTDVNGDGYTTALDALLVINHLERVRLGGEGEDLADLYDASRDVNGSGTIEPLDALIVINTIAAEEAERVALQAMGPRQWERAVDRALVNLELLNGDSDGDDESDWSGQVGPLF